MLWQFYSFALFLSIKTSFKMLSLLIYFVSNGVANLLC